MKNQDGACEGTLLKANNKVDFRWVTSDRKKKKEDREKRPLQRKTKRERRNWSSHSTKIHTYTHLARGLKKEKNQRADNKEKNQNIVKRGGKKTDQRRKRVGEKKTTNQTEQTKQTCGGGAFASEKTHHWRLAFNYWWKAKSMIDFTSFDCMNTIKSFLGTSRAPRDSESEKKQRGRPEPSQ